MKQYIRPNKLKTFDAKPESTQRLINTTLYILDCFGIPVDSTPRRLERMAIAFLACGNVKSIADFKKIKDLNDDYFLKTREVIEYVNKYFSESISSGSYDDIRRKDLKLLTVAKIVLQSSPNSATNDSTRGYCVNPFYANLIRKYGSLDWEQIVKNKLSEIEPLSKKLQRSRQLPKIEVILPSGIELKFSIGKHNDLQKAIIEKFLPNYGYGAKILYVGDTSDKYLYLDKKFF